MEVHIVPCLKDNYAYVLRAGTHTALIDAPETQPIRDFLRQRGWSLDVIFLTHHHWDHTQANVDLKKLFNCKTYSSDADKLKIEGVDECLRDADQILFNNIPIKGLTVPGHTNGHIAYYIPDENALFPGDTLFSAGCGRLFEGTPEQMFQSLNKIKKLPPQTKIYCGHEYTIRNLEFALAEAPNHDVETYYQHVLDLRAKNLPSLPAILETELKINPFLRAESIEEFIRLRNLRNQW